MKRILHSFNRPDARVSLSLSMLLLAVVTLFVTAPKDDEFWWTDAPGHALNGALLHDYIATFDFNSAMKFATNYYLRYPALTITLYPPLMPIVEAMVYIGTGVSNFGAQLSVAIFTAVLAYFLYDAVRTAFSPLAAVGAALLVLSMPAVALWSRQVMLEIPALALLAAAAAFFLRFLEDGKAWRLYLSVLLLCGAAYTKQPAIFAIVPFALSLLVETRGAALRQSSTWFAAALGFCLLLPLAGFIIILDRYNLEEVAGIGPEAGSNFAVASWLWYARALPGIAGWAALVAAVGYLVVLAWAGPASRRERRLVTLMLAWFITDYIFISPIAHREPRYGIFLIVPIAILAIGLVVRGLPRAIAAEAAVAIGALAFVITVATQPVPRVSGYDAVAAFILQHADKNSVVLFHGYRSPNFVFSLRAQSVAPKLYVLRSEKLLLNYRISRDSGVTDRGVSRSALEQIVDRYGVSYVVFQPDFWTDLPSMAAMQDFIYSDRFSKIAEFPIRGNVPIPEHELMIFKNNRPTHPENPEIELNMPLLGGKISGNIR